jgi:hypothetical protein
MAAAVVVAAAAVTESAALVVTLALMVIPVTLVQMDRVLLLAVLALPVTLVLRALPEIPEMQVLAQHQVAQALPATLEPTETPGIRVMLAQVLLLAALRLHAGLARMARMVMPVILARRGLALLMVARLQLVGLAKPGLRVITGLVPQTVMPVLRVIPVMHLPSVT